MLAAGADQGGRALSVSYTDASPLVLGALWGLISSFIKTHLLGIALYGPFNRYRCH